MSRCVPSRDGFPLVSIIVPSYNQGRFIRKTLESILDQDYRPLEIVVVDGASNDGTVEILRHFETVPEVRWVSEPDRGVVEAVNKGLSRARGDIGAIQSSDDFYVPGAIRAAVNALLEDSSLAFIFGDIAKVDAAGNEFMRTQLPPFSLEAVLSRETWIPQPSTFFRIDIARALGGWREEVSYVADVDLWIRMALTHPARKLDTVMAQYSVHDAQRDQQKQRIARDYRAMIDGMALPSVLRRAAVAGKHLTSIHYGPDLGRFERSILFWRAAVAYPKLFSRLSVGAFIPWFYEVRAFARARLRRTSFAS